MTKISGARPHKYRALQKVADCRVDHVRKAVISQCISVYTFHHGIRLPAAHLHDLGIGKVVMMTGDNQRTAQAVANQLGLDEFHAEVLPEDKAAFIRAEHEAGRKVMMIGDGINDTPALSEADVGIAVSDGAAIAREIADITIATDNLYALPMLRYLSDRLMERINRNYRFIMSFNMGLIGLGVLGIMLPGSSALLHNLSTIAISLESMTSLTDTLPAAMEEPVHQLELRKA